MGIRRYIQLISIIVSLSSAIYLVWRVLRMKERKPFMIAPVVFFIHVAIYYTAIFLFIQFDIDELLGFTFVANSWAAGLTLHAAITVLYLSCLMLQCIRPTNE